MGQRRELSFEASGLDLGGQRALAESAVDALQELGVEVQPTPVGQPGAFRAQTPFSVELGTGQLNELALRWAQCVAGVAPGATATLMSRAEGLGSTAWETHAPIPDPAGVVILSKDEVEPPPPAFADPPPPRPAPAPAPRPQPSPPTYNDPMAGTSLGLGITSLVLNLACCGILGVPLGIGALVVGFKSLQNQSADPQIGGRSQAIAGLVTGGIGVAIGVGVFLLYVLALLMETV